MSTTFARWRSSKLRPPCNGPMDELFAAVLGGKQDDELALLRIALLSRLPSRCPDDALDALGEWFNLPRFDGEADGTVTSGYRGRLCAAWSTWQKAGSAEAIIDSLEAYGFVDVEVYTTTEQLREDGTEVPAWTSPVGNYSDFWVVLGPDFGTLAPIEPLVMPFTLGSPTTLGTTAPDTVINAIKGQILKWKAAHAYPRGVVFLFSGVLLGAPLTMPFTLGGSSAMIAAFT
jgi:hypothetical protein